MVNDVRFQLITELTKQNGLALTYNKPNQNIPDIKYKYEEAGCNLNSSTVCNNADGSVLYYEVYYPTCYPYATETKQPPVIFMGHPGGYSDCSSIDNTPEISGMCKELAKRGFVFFNIEYRRGRVITQDKGLIGYDDPFDDPSTETFTISFTSAQQTLAIFRGLQDFNGAIRTILYRNTLTETPYKFDPENIFMAGASAGALATMTLTYYTDNMINQISAGANGATYAGPLKPNPNWYIGGSVFDSYRSNIKGVLNMWGGLTTPLDNELVNFLANASPVPLISFQGAKDKTAWPYRVPLYYAPYRTGDDAIYSEFLEPSTIPDRENLAIEAKCLLGSPQSYIPNPDDELTALGQPALVRDGTVFGANKIWCYMMRDLPVANRVYSELYVDLQMRHGVDNPALHNFGTGYTTKTEIFKYMAERSATFFQACLQGNVFLNRLKNSDKNLQVFVECKNSRVKACYVQGSVDDSADNNACSYNTNDDEAQESEVCDGLFDNIIF